MPMLEEYLSTDDVDNIQQIADLDADIAAARMLMASETDTGWSYEHCLAETTKRERRFGVGSFYFYGPMGNGRASLRANETLAARPNRK